MKKNMIIGLFAVLLTFTLGGHSASFSLAVPSAFAGKYSSKTIEETICHYTAGQANPAETITVGDPAVLNAHMNHGDTVGSCLVCPPGVSSCFRADGKPGAPGAIRIAGTSGIAGTPGTSGSGVTQISSMRELRGA